MTSEKDFYYKKSRLNQLRGFCNVVQCGCSGVKAAEKSHIEPTAISKQISSLERDLGIKLFERARGHRMSLTKEGKLFYELAIKQMQGMDSLFESFNEHLKNFNDNHLNIACHYTAAIYIMPNIISNLLNQERFRDINIKIMEISRDEAIKRLKNKEIDLIYYPFDSDYEIPNEFDIILNIKHNHAIILNKGHYLEHKEKITIEDLKEHNFIVRDKDSSIFKLYKNLNLKCFNLSFENCSIDTSLQFAKALNCITGIPEKMYELGNLKYDSSIVSKNVNYLFGKSYFKILTLKNSILKDSVNFILNELKKLK